MEQNKQIRLTSAEITSLWIGYINDSSIRCIFEYFLVKAEDKEIKELIHHALELTKGNLNTLEEIFKKENYPIPYGFKIDKDVDLLAPRLYSDVYVLHYLHNASQIALQGYSVNLALAVRSDVYSYFNECLTQQTTFLRRVKELLLSKGLYIRSPYIPTPDNNDFVKRQNFLSGFFGEKRALTGMEITNLYANFQRNAFGQATLIGFSQVAQNKDVANYFVRGKEIAKKHCQVFDSILKEEDLPVPMSWDAEVSTSTTFTFSDKIMMFYTTSLIALSVGYYGTSIAMSPRRDLGVHYTRLSAEILKFAEDGANIMINNGWLEQPPIAADRDQLANGER